MSREKTSYTFRSLQELLQHDAELQEKHSEGYEFWYRGERSEAFKLVPSLYRFLDDEKQQREFLEENKEESLINDFYIYSLQKLERPPVSGWEWLAIMQHHGLPTRLLDWSENILQAAYFAIETWDTSDSKNSPTIYVINPNKLNKASTGDDQVYIADGPKLESWLPKTIRIFPNLIDLSVNSNKPTKAYSNKPIAIYVQHFFSRLRQQRGCFILFGDYMNDLHTFSRENNDFNIFEFKLDTQNLETEDDRKNLKHDLLVDLNRCGINRYSTYDDLDSLSKYLSWRFLKR